MAPSRLEVGRIGRAHGLRGEVAVTFTSRTTTKCTVVGTTVTLVAVMVTSLLRDRIGLRAWRLVHWLSYAFWPIAIVHGIGIGTDTGAAWMLVINAACIAAVIAAANCGQWSRPYSSIEVRNVRQTRFPMPRARSGRPRVSRRAGASGTAAFGRCSYARGAEGVLSGFGCCHNEPAKCGAQLSKTIPLLAGLLFHIETPVDLNHH
jgi:hypothetical protein